MIERKSVFSSAAAMIIVCSTPALCANDSAIGKDLKATIALQGQPCDQIASTQRNADSDYLVSCRDGNRYRVFVNELGRVVVQKQ